MSEGFDRRWTWALVALAVAVVAVVVTWSALETDDADEPADDAAVAPRPGEEGPLVADLYFPGTGGRLVTEPRELPRHPEARAQVEELVRAVLAGPEREDAIAPLPEGIALAGVHLDAAGVAYVDLVEPEGGPPPPSGSLQEMLTVYSLVDSVLLNVAEVEGVVVLWNGRQRDSFAGHLDTSRPLTANRELVAR